jgi:hypothetical protein
MAGIWIEEVLTGIKGGKREEKQYCLSLPGKNWLRDAQ